MGEAWAALLGAVVGGLLTLAATFLIELRQDRRRRIGAARLVLAEFRRGELEILVHADDEESWIEGPHSTISSEAWLHHAAEFVGSLSQEAFTSVDDAAEFLRQSGEYGFTVKGIPADVKQITRARAMLEPIAQPTWFDRHVWRL